MDPVIYCVDIGSVPNNKFGWARLEVDESAVESHQGGSEILDLVAGIADDVADGHKVAVGFESPMFVPVPEQALQLGMARTGEGSRSWSAGAGAGSLATGIAQVAWILGELRTKLPQTAAYLAWEEFEASSSGGLFLWEAFVTQKAKAMTHVEDAKVAVMAFREALPNPSGASAVTAERPLSILGTALLWSGWSKDVELVHQPCVVIKPAPRER